MSEEDQHERSSSNELSDSPELTRVTIQQHVGDTDATDSHGQNVLSNEDAAPSMRQEDVKNETAVKQIASAPPPTGPGWSKLSEQIYMCKSSPIKNNTNVYMGKRKCDGEWHDIAVKLIQFDETHVKEVKLNQRINGHPNVIKTYETDIIDGGLLTYIYIAMELCSQTLKDFIHDHKRKSFDFKLHFNIAKQILAGIAYIHDNNILHRDIKLENILLSQSKDSIRIADFGMSTQLEDGHLFASATFRGIGSDAYRAPELLGKNPKASFRSDSFSLGIVLAMFFANGHHPFGPDPFRWRQNMMDNKGKDLSHIVQFVEPYTYKRDQLVQLIESCLQPDPQSRPTPKEMLEHAFFTSTSECKSQTEPAPSQVKESSDTGPLSVFMSARERNIKHLEDQLNESLRNGETETYSVILEELKQLREKDNLEVVIQLAEYEMKSKKNDSPVNKLRDFIVSTGSRSSIEVNAMAANAVAMGQSIQALMFFKISHDVHKQEAKLCPKLERHFINRNLDGVTVSTKCLLQQGGSARDIATQFGVRYIEEMLTDLRSVEGIGSGELELTLNEANCVQNLTVFTTQLLDFAKTIRYAEEAIEKMRRELGDGIVYYKTYSHLMNNLAVAYRGTGELEKAEICFLAAIEGCMKALDCDSEDERQQHLRGITANSERR